MNMICQAARWSQAKRLSMLKNRRKKRVFDV
jgi:hypothetical protein